MNTARDHARYIGILFGAITAMTTWRNMATADFAVIASSAGSIAFTMWLVWYLGLELFVWMVDIYVCTEYKRRPTDEAPTADELPRTMVGQDAPHAAEDDTVGDSESEPITVEYRPRVERVSYQPEWINREELPPTVERLWLSELHEARGNGLLDKVSANKLHTFTSADRLSKDSSGMSQADYFKQWLVDRHHIYADSANGQHEFTGVGNAYFPPPLDS